MSDSVNWHSSLAEYRTAGILACCCLLLIVIATVKPELFEITPDSPATAGSAASASTPANDYAAPPPTRDEPAGNIRSEKQTVTHTEQVTKPFKPAVIEARPAVKTAKAAVTQPQIAIAKPVPTTPAGTAGGYYVQLGAFSEKARAQGLVDQLKQHGWPAVIHAKSSRLFAVWAGPKSDRKSAEGLQQTIQGKMKLKGFIIQHKTT